MVRGTVVNKMAEPLGHHFIFVNIKLLEIIVSQVVQIRPEDLDVTELAVVSRSCGVERGLHRGQLLLNTLVKAQMVNKIPAFFILVLKEIEERRFEHALELNHRAFKCARILRKSTIGRADLIGIGKVKAIADVLKNR